MAPELFTSVKKAGPLGPAFAISLLSLERPPRFSQQSPDSPHYEHYIPCAQRYPEETAGSRLASKARKLASKLTPEQRRARFHKGMAMIYGGANAKEAALARR